MTESQSITNVLSVLRNGVVTIPRQTRDYLGIVPGDMIKVTIEKVR